MHRRQLQDFILFYFTQRWNVYRTVHHRQLPMYGIINRHESDILTNDSGLFKVIQFIQETARIVKSNGHSLHITLQKVQKIVSSHHSCSKVTRSFLLEFHYKVWCYDLPAPTSSTSPTSWTQPAPPYSGTGHVYGPPFCRTRIYIFFLQGEKRFSGERRYIWRLLWVSMKKDFLLARPKILIAK
jgi:hypothetical protein